MKKDIDEKSRKHRPFLVKAMDANIFCHSSLFLLLSLFLLKELVKHGPKKLDALTRVNLPVNLFSQTNCLEFIPKHMLHWFSPDKILVSRETKDQVLTYF